jgi:hypothetical protein
MLVQVVHVFYIGVIRDNRKTGIGQEVVNGLYKGWGKSMVNLDMPISAFLFRYLQKRKPGQNLDRTWTEPRKSLDRIENSRSDRGQ